MNNKLDNFNRLEEEIQYLQEMTQKIEPYWMKYIEFHRDFVKNIILLSAGIIGFSVPIFGKVEIIKSQLLFLLSLVGFIGVVIGGLVYLKILLSNDKKYIEETMKFGVNLGKTTFDSIELAKKMKDEHKGEMEEKMIKDVMTQFGGLTNTMKQDLPFQKMYNWLFNVIFSVFIIALVLLFLSLINY